MSTHNIGFHGDWRGDSNEHPQLGLGTAYRNRTAVYRGTLLRTAVCTTVYRNSIKLTVIVNLSAAMDIHSIDMATSHGV